MNRQYSVSVEDGTQAGQLIKRLQCRQQKTEGLKLPRKYSPHHYITSSLLPLLQSRMETYLHVIYTEFWPNQTNVTADINLSDQTMFLQSSIIHFWWGCVNWGFLLLYPICFHLFHVFCVQRCSSACLVIISRYLSCCCSRCSYLLEAGRPISSDLCH